MIEVVLFLLGLTLGMIIGIGVLFALMGKKLRDQYLGRGEKENTPIVLDWIDGKRKDFHITMSGVVVYIGAICNITLQQSFDTSRVHIELCSKLEAMREFRG